MVTASVSQIKIKARTFDILWHRFGPHKLSLQSSADRHGISRERARQIQGKGISDLSKNSTFIAIKQLSERFFHCQGYLTTRVISKIAEDQIGSDQPQLCAVIAHLVLMPLKGGLIPSISKQAAVANKSIANSMRMISNQAIQSDQEEGHLLAHMLVERLIIEAIIYDENSYSLMELHDSIVHLVIQAPRPSQAIWGSANLARRILQKVNHPMHWYDIADQVSDRLQELGKNPLSKYSIRNALFNNEHWFIRTGIGIWGLCEWENECSKSIKPLMNN